MSSKRIQLAVGIAALSLAHLPAPVRAQGELAPPPAPESAGAGAGPTLDLTLLGGYGQLDVHGSREEYYRYHTAPTGLYWNLVRALRRAAAGGIEADAWWRNPGQADELGFVGLYPRGTGSWLRYRRQAAEFTGDARLSGRPPARRQENRLQLHLEGASTPAVDLEFREQALRIPALGRLSPYAGPDYAVRDFTAAARVPLGVASLTLTPRLRTYDGQAAAHPDRRITWLTAEAEAPLGGSAEGRLLLERVATGVSGRETASVNLVQAEGSYRANPLLFLDGFFRHRETDLPDTATPFADRSRSAGLSAAYYPWPATTVRAGVTREAVRRANLEFGRSETTGQTDAWLQLRRRDPGLWTAQARYRFRGLDDGPTARMSGLPSRESLYYTRNHSLDTRFDYTPSPRLSAYVDYGWRQRENSDRSLRLTLNSLTVGVVSPLSERLTLTGEMTLQSWDGDTRPLRGGGGVPAGDLPPSLFYSDGRLFTATSTYVLGRYSALEFSYNHFAATGGQSARDHLATLLFRQEVSRRFYFAAGFQYESLRDLESDRGYHAFPLVLHVGYQGRFR